VIAEFELRNPETAECESYNLHLEKGKLEGNDDCGVRIADRYINNKEPRSKLRGIQRRSFMNREDLEEWTKEFALQIIRFVSALPKNKVANVMAYQLLKSGTSIGANYREASRAEARSDFIHKIAIAEKEAAETEYWLELFKEEGIGDADRLHWLGKENQELLAILTASGRTAKRGRK